MQDFFNDGGGLAYIILNYSTVGLVRRWTGFLDQNKIMTVFPVATTNQCLIALTGDPMEKQDTRMISSQEKT
jgi:hypothetical protein